ncbi:MAG: putative metallopeptidase [Nanoarchaeota archaeon]
MRYEKADDIQRMAEEIVEKLNLRHIDTENIACIRSHGSKTRGVIARCHALGKVMQKGMKRKAFYTLEFLSKRFDKLSEEDKIKTIIHELMHIPNCFGGGFKHHDYVTEKNIITFYERYKNAF